EVFEAEATFEQLLGVALGLLLVDDLLEVLHEADDVAEAEDAAGHAVGAEELELIDALAHTGEADRCTRDVAHRQGCATACVAVELGEEDTSQPDALMKRSGSLDRVLTDHGVDDEQDVLRPSLGLDVGELLHQRLVDR